MNAPSLASCASGRIPRVAPVTVSVMKSTIVQIVRWDAPQPQRDESVCSARGAGTCIRDLVADVFLRDAGSPRIHWTVCQHWLEHEPDVAAHEAGRDDRGPEPDRASPR